MRYYTEMCGGLWRIFAESYAAEGIGSWNDNSTWKYAWPDSCRDIHSIGEDIYGNQLVTMHGTPNALFWNHENGHATDLLFHPKELLELVSREGIEWIDYYTPDIIRVGRVSLGNLEQVNHLHFVTPLVLGGTPSLKNISHLNRTLHLRGHGELWQGIGDLDAGTVIIPK